jgi:methionyl aminopeptidase
MLLILFCNIVKPGVRYRDFGKVIEEHAKKNGFSVVRTFSGHGINQLFHCAPNVPHYNSKLFSLSVHYSV